MQRETISKNNQARNIAVPDIRRYRLGIAWFTARDNDNKLAEDITINIIKELTKMLGEDNVVELNSDRKDRREDLKELNK